MWAVWTLEKLLTSVGQHVVTELLLAINSTHALATDGTHHGRHRLQQRGERLSLLRCHHTGWEMMAKADRMTEKHEAG